MEYKPIEWYKTHHSTNLGVPQETVVITQQRAKKNNDFFNARRKTKLSRIYDLIFMTDAVRKRNLKFSIMDFPNLVPKQHRELSSERIKKWQLTGLAEVKESREEKSKPTENIQK